MLATVADYDSALVSLTAEVASDYTAMRTFEVLIQIARENAKVQKEGLDIAESRFRNGATSELDVAQAKSLLERTLADIPDFQASLQRTKNALSILLGQPPGRIDALLRGPQRIPAASRTSGVRLAGRSLAPASRYSRRRAERSGGGGAHRRGGGRSLSALLSHRRYWRPSQRRRQALRARQYVFHRRAGFRWSILNYGRITNNVRAQDARFQQALVNYEDTVIKAAREVEDGLIGFLKAQESAVNSQVGRGRAECVNSR